MEFKYAEFTEEQVAFLAEYQPENRHFTTWDEMRKIVSVLQVKGKDTEDKRAIRNSVVRYYSENMEAERKGQDRYEVWSRLNTAMQSITTAIDSVALIPEEKISGK